VIYACRSACAVEGSLNTFRLASQLGSPTAPCGPRTAGVEEWGKATSPDQRALRFMIDKWCGRLFDLVLGCRPAVVGCYSSQGFGLLVVTLSSHCRHRPSAFRRRAWLASLEAAYLPEVFDLPAILGCPNISDEVHLLEIPVQCRRRLAGRSKVAGTLRGTLKAGLRIVATFARIAGERR
jgi:hypothetical protein